MSKFKVGDKVKLIHPCSGSKIYTHCGRKQFPLGSIATIIKAEYIGADKDSFVDIELKCGTIATGVFSYRFKKVNDMDHLYDNEKPFGLLSEEEQQHLKTHEDQGILYFDGKNWVNSFLGSFSGHIAYRLKHLPERVTVTSLTGTVEMKDGKPDWSTYKE